MNATIAPATLDTWDYVTLTVMVALTTAVGFYHAFKVKKTSNTKEFLVSSKGIGFLPVALSTVATAISPTSMQGYPLEIYMSGIQFVLLSASQFIGIGLFAILYLPVYYNLGFSSIFQYLEYRFNRTVRMMASIINTTLSVFFTACIIYAPALALNQVTGLNLWGSVISIGGVCIIYTALGGIKAVIWADVMQLIVILVAMFVVLIKGSIDVGGFQTIWDRAKEGQRLNFYLHSSKYSRDTIWTYIIGGTFYGLNSLVANQMFVQRFLSNPNLGRARWSLYLTAIIGKGMIIFYAIIGLAMYAKYYNCDPKMSGIVASRDQLVSLFAVDTLRFVKGFPGIFVAGVLCATLSTLSSILNALSAITLTDYIRPFYPNLTDATATKVSKILAAVYGVLCIACVALAANMGGIVRAIFTIGGAIGGPLFTVFTLGVLFPWVNSKGAISSFIAGLLIGGWSAIGSLMHKGQSLHAPLVSTGCNITTHLMSNLSSMDFSHLMNSTTTSMPTQADMWNATQVGEVPEFGRTQEVLVFPPEEVFFLYTLSPLWYTVITAMAGMVVGIAVSIVTGPQNPEELDPRLISPAVEKLCRSLPKKYCSFLGYTSDKVKAPLKKIPESFVKETEEVLELKVPLKSDEKI